MVIGERLREIRKSKNMTIYKLSQETGISQNHIKDLENGRRNPSIDTLSRLTTPLGISLSELFNSDRTISYLSDKERLLIEYYRTLPDKKAELLLLLGKALKD